MLGLSLLFTIDQPEFRLLKYMYWNFSGDIYGAEVLVEWHTRLRSEQKFSGLEELVASNSNG